MEKLNAYSPLIVLNLRNWNLIEYAVRHLFIYFLKRELFEKVSSVKTHTQSQSVKVQSLLCSVSPSLLSASFCTSLLLDVRHLIITLFPPVLSPV